MSEESGQQLYCRNCGATVRPGMSFCTSCGQQATVRHDGSDVPDAEASTGGYGSRGVNLPRPKNVRFVLLVFGTIVSLAVVYLLFSYSVAVAILLIGLLAVAALLVRRVRGTQTGFEASLFRRANDYKYATQTAYRQGKHKELAQGAYRQSKKAAEEANNRYQTWVERQAAEREHAELLNRIQRERDQRWATLDRYKKFFEKASSGSRNCLDWWRAYDDQPDEGQSSVSHLLQTAVRRAEAGLVRTTGMETSLSNLLQQDRFGEADRLLAGLNHEQEDFDGDASVFPPLVAVHDKVKELEDWASYRSELESFVKDLEDLLGSPAVRTAAANRVRFPDPAGKRSSVTEAAPPAGSDARAGGGTYCPNCGDKNVGEARFCSRCGTVLDRMESRSAQPRGIGAARSEVDAGVATSSIVFSIVCSAVSLFFLPPAFGGLGVYFGFRAKQYGFEAAGVAMMVVSGACLLLGMFWGSLTWGL